MPNVSKKKSKLMGLAENNPNAVSDKNKGVLKMSHSQLHDYASTSESGLPNRAHAPKRKRP